MNESVEQEGSREGTMLTAVSCSSVIVKLIRLARQRTHTHPDTHTMKYQKRQYKYKSDKSSSSNNNNKAKSQKPSKCVIELLTISFPYGVRGTEGRGTCTCDMNIECNESSNNHGTMATLAPFLWQLFGLRFKALKELRAQLARDREIKRKEGGGREKGETERQIAWHNYAQITTNIWLEIRQKRLEIELKGVKQEMGMRGIEIQMYPRLNQYKITAINLNYCISDAITLY